jgi:hypothetical protein
MVFIQILKSVLGLLNAILYLTHYFKLLLKMEDQEDKEEGERLNKFFKEWLKDF